MRHERQEYVDRILTPVNTIQDAQGIIIGTAQLRVVAYDWQFLSPQLETDEIGRQFGFLHPYVLRKMNTALAVYDDKIPTEAQALNLLQAHMKAPTEVTGYYLALLKKLSADRATFIRDGLVMNMIVGLSAFNKIDYREAVNHFASVHKSEFRDLSKRYDQAREIQDYL